MKLLLLATCGKKDEAEEPKYLHIYFSSLKKHILPHFETKVILFNSSLLGDSSKSTTYDLIQKYGLQDVVELKSVDELDLPEKSVSFLKEQSWLVRIGLIMNTLFDYAKRKRFYEADWIFHTDTDIKFLDNFNKTLQTASNLLQLNKSVVITLAGDAFYENIRYNNTMVAFYPPPKMDLYNEETLTRNFCISHIKKEFRNNYVTNTDKLIYTTQQQKIRNDFVGISNKAAYDIEFNWVNYNYSYNFYSMLPGGEELEKWWKEFGSSAVDFRITHDKGSIPQMKFQEGAEKGYSTTFKLQLPAAQCMAYHYGSGWEGNTNFFKHTLKHLEEEFLEYKDLWKEDYSGVE